MLAWADLQAQIRSSESVFIKLLDSGVVNNLVGPFEGVSHRRRMNLEEKANVVAAVWGDIR